MKIKKFKIETLVIIAVVLCSLFTTSCKHKHNYVNGVCSCGEKDSNIPPHIHNFINGVCNCGETEGLVTPNIELDKKYYIIGDTINFNVTNYESLDLFDITYELNAGIKVNKNGQYIASKTGEYDVTFTLKEDANYSYTINIPIYKRYFSLDVTTETMTVGDKIDFWIYDFDDLYEQSNSDFTFSIDDEGVATLEGNTVTALKTGSFNITATSIHNENVKSSINITVADLENTFILRPTMDYKEVKVGDQFYMNLNLGFNAKDFTWNTTDSEVIRVAIMDDLCQITIVGEGQGGITCYNNDDPLIRSKYVVNVKGIADINYIERLLDLAYSQVGIKEEGDNIQKYGEWYENNGQPWCATFVSWCWYHAGLSNDLLLKYQGCTAGMKWCSEQGIMHYVQDFTFPQSHNMANGIYEYKKEDYIPQAGDIVFFLSNGAGHTGIVAYSDGTYVYTIEGNRSNKVGVWRLKLTNNTITGYASPKYPATSKTTDYSWIKDQQADGSYLWTNVSSGDSTT